MLMAKDRIMAEIFAFSDRPLGDVIEETGGDRGHLGELVKFVGAKEFNE